MAATSTLAAIVREVAARLYPGRIVTGATTSEVDSSSILDNANLLDNDANSNTYNKVWVRIDEFVTGGPSVGEAQRVRDAGYAGGTGDLTTEAFSASVNTSTDFSLHYILKPSEVDDAVNLVLSNTFHRTYHPLSLVLNHDYETSTTSGSDELISGNNWTLSGSNTFKQLSTASRVSWGRFTGRHENNASSDYVESDALPAHEGDQWVIWATAQADVGTGTLIAYDSTNGANIKTATTNEEAHTDLLFEFNIPSGCEAVTVRLQGTGASDDVYWGPVVLFSLNRRILNLPSWLDESKRLSGLFWFLQGTSSSGSGESDAYRSFETRPRPLAYEPLFDPLQANPRRVEVDLSFILGPVFLYGWRPFASISSPSGSATADTTLMDHDTLIVGTLAECHRKIQNRLSHTDEAASAWHRGEASRLEGKFRELLETHDYAEPETEEILPSRVGVRLR